MQTNYTRPAYDRCVNAIVYEHCHILLYCSSCAYTLAYTAVLQQLCIYTGVYYCIVTAVFVPIIQQCNLVQYIAAIYKASKGSIVSVPKYTCTQLMYTQVVEYITVRAPDIIIYYICPHTMQATHISMLLISKLKLYEMFRQSDKPNSTMRLKHPKEIGPRH